MAKSDTTDQPQAASLAELRAACPGAPAEFVLDQLEQGATVATATAAWNAKQIADLKAANEALLKEKAALEARKTPDANAGQQPVGETKPAGDANIGDPIAEWYAALGEQMKLGKSKREAVKYLANANAELHQAYLDAHNAKHGAAWKQHR